MWRSEFRRYATSQKATGSSSDEVIEFSQVTQSFHPNYGPLLTQLLTEMCSRKCF
jgi:hypothetical protein